MTWQPPAAGVVDSFEITCVARGTSPVKGAVNGSTFAAKVGPLETTSKEYTCSVLALNEFGSSDARDSNSFLTG